jgi:hypothetical protein
VKIPKLSEIADRIHAHLRRIEADPELNPWDDGKVNGTKPFFHAGAHVAGARVGVRYISYQGVTNLKKADAVKYLAWLDAGNVGKHWKISL